MNNDSPKSTWAAIGAGIVLVGGVSYYSLQPAPSQPTIGIVAEYKKEDAWEIPESIYEWSYKTNISDKWRVYTNIVGTNVIRVPKTEFQQGFFTITKIMRKGFTNVYITRQNGGL